MYLGAFGLKDPLRPNVKSMVQTVANKGHVNVRMISGDHHETAVEVARKAGIINIEDLEEQEDVVMDAEKFRNLVGEIHDSKDPETGEIKYYVENEEVFIDLQERLKVITRANPDDKLLMTIGLRSMGKTVAVTGDGINDIDALE